MFILLSVENVSCYIEVLEENNICLKDFYIRQLEKIPNYYSTRSVFCGVLILLSVEPFFFPQLGFFAPYFNNFFLVIQKRILVINSVETTCVMSFFRTLL